ncbi:MAG: fatty acyl-CoA synthetase [Salinisphaeraceae bacterium]
MNNQTMAAPATGNTIGEALTRSVRRNPEATALIFGDRRWTFAELDGAVKRVANGLIASGLQPGERVAAYAHNSDAYALLWLACCRAGLVHVPVNYSMTTSELAYILEQCGASALFIDDQAHADVDTAQQGSQVRLLGHMAGGGEPDVLAWAQGAASDADPGVPVDETELAQLLYTSGTTSAPKGAMMTHRALMAHYTSTIIALSIDPNELFLGALPLYHSAPTHVFLMPQLLMGGATALIDGPKPGPVFDYIEKHGAAAFFAPPTAWIALLRDPDFDNRDLSALKKAYYGAAIMPEPVLHELRERLPGIQVYNCYGQSEIGPLATVLQPAEHDDRPTSAGRPVFNVDMRIVDEDMNDVPVGELGEIVYRSPQLLQAYWDKPEQTEESFAGGWFHSGDVGRFDEGGYVYVVDRIKDIINTGGVTLSSRDVEDCLYTHPAVAEVAVIGLPDDKWIEKVAAVVCLKAGESADAAALEAHAREHLSAYKVPKVIHFVDDLPRNASGKLLKRELRDRFSE